MDRIDYALLIALALYGAYIFRVAKAPRQDRRALRVIVALVVAIIGYTVLKQVFIAWGIQAR